jgi:hypothetical protein
MKVKPKEVNIKPNEMNDFLLEMNLFQKNMKYFSCPVRVSGRKQNVNSGLVHFASSFHSHR